MVAGAQPGALKRQLVEIRSHIEVFELRLGEVQPRESAPSIADGGSTTGVTVFILMPFDAEFDWLYQLVKEACSEAGVTAERADDVFEAGIVIDQVKEKIAEADAVIAVCTGKNANVFYELGIAEATHRPVLIAESKDDLPFDIAHFRAQLYGGSESANSRETLQERIERAVTETIRSSTPARAANLSPGADADNADVVAAIVATGRRHSYRLVITNRGPGVARNVSAALTSVTHPDERVLVHDSEFPIPQLVVSQEYPVTMAAAGNAPPPYDCLLSWEDGAGERCATLRLSLP